MKLLDEEDAVNGMEKRNTLKTVAERKTTKFRGKNFIAKGLRV